MASGEADLSWRFPSPAHGRSTCTGGAQAATALAADTAFSHAPGEGIAAVSWRSWSDHCVCMPCLPWLPELALSDGARNWDYRTANDVKPRNNRAATRLTCWLRSSDIPTSWASPSSRIWLPVIASCGVGCF